MKRRKLLTLNRILKHIPARHSLQNVFFDLLRLKPSSGSNEDYSAKLNEQRKWLVLILEFAPWAKNATPASPSTCPS
jgi:hypothetical protein